VLCAESTCKSRPFSDGSTFCATSDAPDIPVEAGLMKRGWTCFNGKLSSTCHLDIDSYMIGTGCLDIYHAQMLMWGEQNRVERLLVQRHALRRL
jgi:hypothetical protein